MIGHRLIILHTTYPLIATESNEGAIDSIAWRRDKRDVLTPTKAGFAWLREKKGLALVAALTGPAERADPPKERNVLRALFGADRYARLTEILLAPRVTIPFSLFYF